MNYRLACLALLILVQLTPAQSPADVEKQLVADLRFLTSDECEGRGVGTKGLDLAADYIERQFVNAGLKPGGPKGSYYQPFGLITEVKRGTGNRLLLKGPLGQTITLQQGTHFSAWALGGNGKAEAPVVFAGYGITSENPKYDDYAGLDVAGKIVLVLSGSPRQGNAYADVFEEAGVDVSLTAKLENALRHKAAGLLFVSRGLGKAGDGINPVGPREGESVSLPAAQIQRRVADAMFSSTGSAGLDDIERLMDADLKPRSMLLPGWTCRLESEIALTRVPVKNVIGVLEGKGPLANETVVIGAHYDHVGYFGSVSNALVKPTGFSTPGGIGGAGFPLAQLWVTGVHHGADDNASGTVALIQVARHLGAQKNRQGRRLVFIAFSAEESGLVGSFYYCRKPVFPLRNTTTMVNMDMVGRLQDDKLVAGGIGTGDTFGAMIDKLNKKYAFKLMKEPAGTAPTDNTGFYLKKVPVLWFFTGFHEQYHRPTDRLETINIPGLRRIGELVSDVVAEVSTTPKRPVYAKTGGLDRAKTLWSKAPATGMIVDYYQSSQEGVLLSAVVPNTPAARAGLRKGDRVLALAGKKVSGPAEFLIMTRALTPGKTVDVAVSREGKMNTVKLQLVNVERYTDPMFGFLADISKLTDGLLVTEVPANSLAAAAGLRKGDRILAIAGTSVRSMEAYAGALKTLKPGKEVALTIQRDSKEQKLQVRTASINAPVSMPATPAPATAPGGQSEEIDGGAAAYPPARRGFFGRRLFGRRSYCP